ncbi:MAG TPA: DUF2905 domain-containing protein [Candidatus Angelobacter sp.]|nr:DUF2905 domain-containing protein [Candidatus Angelobacter sp.]
MGKLLLLMGSVIAMMGAVLLFAGRFNFPTGRLPGDFTWRGRNTIVYFPFATSIVISIVFSAVLWLIQRIRH